jgi:hypothetical protein
LLTRALRRLSDATIMAKQDRAMVDASSFATHMRQLRHSAFGLAKAGRDRRGQFLVDARRASDAAARDGKGYAHTALDSLVRYINGYGATGTIDEDLVELHLDVAEGNAGDATGALPRLAAQVDRALGLAAAV